MTYPFPNYSGETIEIWDWTSYVISHFTGRMNTYLYWNKLVHVNERNSQYFELQK